MPPLVREEFRPTLPELLAPRVRRLGRGGRWALAVLAALIVVAVLVLVVRGSGDGTTSYVRTAQPQFNLLYDAKATPKRAAQGDELLRLEGRRGDLFLQSFTVAPWALPAYTGTVDGVLPMEAEQRLVPELQRRFPGFERLTPEGRVRLNEISAGYGLIFRARLGERRLYGRAALVPEPVAHPRRAMLLLLLATPAAGVSGPAALGYDGKLKTPYRSFRWGTEKS
jgi:hypothetical protein